MSFFISDVYAQAGGQAGGNPMMSLVLFGGVFAIMYFMMIRPHQKRQKEHKALVGGLSKGDEIVTSGGLLGRITKVGDNFLTVEIAEGMEVRVQRASVAAVMPKGTVKSA